MRKLDLEQNSPEWEAFRRTHIGASDSPIICGVSPFKTAHKLWQEKAIGEVGPPNQAMEEGHRLEPLARLKAEEHWSMEFPPLCVLHDSVEYLMASLDGYNEETGIVLEVKVVGDRTYKKVEDEGPLKSWVYQVNHQLECSSQDTAYILVMHRDRKTYLTFEIRRDSEIVSEILTKTAEFHKRLVNFDRPKDKYKERDDEDWRMAAESFLRAKISLNTAEEYLNLCKQHLIEISGGECCRGCGVSTMKRDVKGAIDYSKVPELENLDLEKYRKTSREEWRVT